MNRPIPGSLVAAVAMLSLHAAYPAYAQWSAVPLHPQGVYQSSVRAVLGATAGGFVQTQSAASTRNAATWSSFFGPWSGLGTPNGVIHGMNAAHQVGELGSRASLWSGTPASRVQLWNSASSALAGAADQQVGWTFDLVAGRRAALWRGSIASYVSLHPSGASISTANATDGAMQGGFVEFQSGPNGGHRAALWSGTSAFLDLTPPLHAAEVSGMVPGQQVGWTQSNSGGGTHAALWRGTAESWIDLNPAGSTLSACNATAGSIQVGAYGPPGASFAQACVWFGSAESLVNLHVFLPPGYLNSVATSVSIADGITYVGGVASRDFIRTEAFVWVLVPAPRSALPIGAATWLAFRRRRGNPLRA